MAEALIGMFFRALSAQHRAVRIGEEAPLVCEVVSDLQDERARQDLLPAGGE